jgi:hypothetical protein
MQPYNVIPGWTEGPDLESQEENFFDSGFTPKSAIADLDNDTAEPG